jgi:peptidoglycan/LPS O-acetylase OafA/YrhL
VTVLFAVLMFLGVATPAAVHALWGTGSTWPEASAEALARSVVGDGRRRMPPPWQCFVVAVFLGAIALWPFVTLGRGNLEWVTSVTYSIAGIFVARGVAGYTPNWRGYFNDEPFATRDRRYYSPYCLLMGIGYIALLAGEMERL